MSHVTSPVRLCLTSLLCCVFAFGHAPAWLHVATCGEHCQQASIENANGRSVANHSCGCKSHECQTAKGKADRSDSSPNQDSDSGHDSDSCHVCQSLAAPSGLVEYDDVDVVVDVVCELAVFYSATALPTSSISWPPLRGPPVPNSFLTV